MNFVVDRKTSANYNEKLFACHKILEHMESLVSATKHYYLVFLSDNKNCDNKNTREKIDYSDKTVTRLEKLRLIDNTIHEAGKYPFNSKSGAERGTAELKMAMQ